MLATDGMFATDDGVVDVAQIGVDPVEVKDLCTDTATAGYEAFMGIGLGIEGPETPKTVTEHPTAGRDVTWA